MNEERKILPWTIAGIVAILIGLGAGVFAASMGPGSARSPDSTVGTLAVGEASGSLFDDL
ncbi:hypothetical protein ASD65_10215 [Microbacterium sp. Root61]|uniref:hypothetical protein n=1 Tax=Microbacterium sp. Root61 TaxID=1736570 RepID=UPI0006FCE2D0|nr:hypothetical protein [Microbacterium sp. Root61]KRA24753.1 hypothetical protein ASD65_10215 [Microbacterium sp. Root61]